MGHDSVPTHAGTRRRLLAAAGAAALLAPLGAHASNYREITWEELMPGGWDPMKGLENLPADLAALQDSDPRAQAMLSRMREAWDNAPTVPAMAGQDVRLPGYLVPLEEGKAGLREFLLVPYFGACVHTPPPPSNQIVLGRAATPITGFKTMDAVWISGRLEIERADSSMGVASYTMRVQRMVKYQE